VVRLWDLKGRQVAEFRGDWDNTVSLSFSTDSKQIAAAGNKKIGADGDNRKVGKVRLWDIKELDSLIQGGCDWLTDYFKSHPGKKTKQNCA
jgi:WD40 repeat protein